MMTTQEQEQKKKRKRNPNVRVMIPSPKLKELLDSLIPDMKKTKARVKEIFDLGREEGFPDAEIGAMIRLRMDGNYTERYIRMVLPSTAKANTIAHVNAGAKTKKAEKISASENKTEVPNEGTYDSKAVDKLIENAYKCGEEDSQDKYKIFQDTIAAKNKLLKQKDEEIAGLKAELTKKDKRIAELEKALKK